MIEFTCPQCEKTLRIPEKYAGQRGWCNNCKAIITVPIDEQSSSNPQELVTQLVHRFESLLRHSEKLRKEQESNFNKLYTKYQKLKEEGRAEDRTDERLAALQDGVTTAAEGLEALRQAIADGSSTGSSHHEELQREYEEVCTALQEAESQRSALDVDLRVLREEQRHREEALDTERAAKVDALAQVSKAESELASANKEMEELKVARAETAARAQALEEERDRVAAELSEARSGRDEIQVKLTESATLIARLEEQALAQANRISQLEERGAPENAEDRAAQSTQGELSAARQETTRLAAALDAAQAGLRAAQARTADLEEAASKLPAIEGERDATKEELAHLKEALRDAEAVASRMEEQLAASEQTIAELRGRLETAENTLQEHEAEIAAERGRREEAERAFQEVWDRAERAETQETEESASETQATLQQLLAGIDENRLKIDLLTAEITQIANVFTQAAAFAGSTEEEVDLSGEDFTDMTIIDGGMDDEEAIMAALRRFAEPSEDPGSQELT